MLIDPLREGFLLNCISLVCNEKKLVCGIGIKNIEILKLYMYGKREALEQVKIANCANYKHMSSICLYQCRIAESRFTFNRPGLADKGSIEDQLHVNAMSLRSDVTS